MLKSRRSIPMRSEAKKPRRYRGVIVWFALWSILRLPVAVPDFHEVAHHHSEGADCLYHEHLNRWHGKQLTDSGQVDDHPRHDSARLHWHWVIPGTSLPEKETDPLNRTESAPMGPSISEGPGNDSISRMLESAVRAAAVNQSGIDRSEHRSVAGLTFVRAAIDAIRPRVPARRHASLHAFQENVPIRLSLTPLRC